MKELVVEPKKIGIAACGGGATGSQQIGPLEVLEENGIIPDVGIANSVGAIDLGDFFGSGFSTKHLREKWFSFQKPSEVFDLDPYQIAKSIVSELTILGLLAFSNAFHIDPTENKNNAASKRIARIIQKIMNLSGPSYKIEPLIDIICEIDAQRIIEQPQECVITTVNRQLQKVVFFSNKDPEIIADPTKFLLAILASCAIPGLFPLVPIHYKGAWHEFYDAGCEVPLPLMRQLIERGCDTIIVLRCHSDKFKPKLPDGKIRQFVVNMLNATRRLEKNEIKELQRMPNLNVFVIEHKIPWPTSYTTVSFRPEDHRIARAHCKEVALEELDPLIRYVREHPRTTMPQTESV